MPLNRVIILNMIALLAFMGYMFLVGLIVEKWGGRRSGWRVNRLSRACWRLAVGGVGGCGRQSARTDRSGIV